MPMGAVWAQPDEADLITAAAIIRDALREGDISKIDELLTYDVVNKYAFTRKQIVDLWEAGCEFFEAASPDTHSTLCTFLACMKAAYPYLPPMSVIDMEEISSQ